MMRQLKYIRKLFAGENIADVIKGMDADDRKQLNDAVYNLQSYPLNRQQRRKIKRNWEKTVDK